MGNKESISAEAAAPAKVEEKKLRADVVLHLHCLIGNKESISSKAAAPTKVEEKKSCADVEEESEAELKKLEELTVSDNNNADSGLLEDSDDSQVKAVVSGDTVYTSALNFEDLPLSAELIKGLYVEIGFSRPSKIQAMTLPMILTPPYKDLVAQAQHGSGKTTCFILGMLSRVDPNLKATQAICICPTRELAQQNESVLLRLGKLSGITSMCAIPSDSSNFVPAAKLPQVTEQVVIGTPGTIKQYLTHRKLSTRDVKILVFDDANHMLAEDGFRDDSERIMKDIQRSGAHCQVLLFSATFNETVKAFVSKVIKDGNQIFVKKEELIPEKVKQYKVQVPEELSKLQVIKEKICEFGQKIGQTIIFVRSVESRQRLHNTLVKEGYECTSFQNAFAHRDKIIKEFKDGFSKFLITSDLLSRGFDQPQVSLVINYDLPVKFGTPVPEPDYEVYLHRIGKAGRFGSKGAVFNLICRDRDRMIMEKIERHFNHYIPEVPDWRREEHFEKALKDAGLL